MAKAMAMAWDLAMAIAIALELLKFQLPFSKANPVSHLKPLKRLQPVPFIGTSLLSLL